MRAAFFLLPAALVAAAPVGAAVYLSVEQAQALMFPRIKLQQKLVTLTREEAEAITRVTGSPVHNRDLKAWHTKDGAWFIIDQVYGRDDWVAYAVALNRDGVVTSLEILECVADYDTVRMPEWRAQFIGASAGGKLNIQSISGSTLSSRHIAAGVKRVLATYELVLKPRD
jgi:hypothetical protein